MNNDDTTEAGPTEAALESYAWGEEPDEPEGGQDWRSRVTHLLRDDRVIPAAITAVAVAAVSIAGTLALMPGPDHFTIRPAPIEQPAPPAAPKPPPKSVPPPIAAPPAQHQIPPQAPVQAPPDAHQVFTQTLGGDTRQTQNGAGLYPTDPAAVDSEAQSMCQDLANGGAIEPYITGTLAKSPTLAPWQAAQVVHQAIQSYCPQYDR